MGSLFRHRGQTGRGGRGAGRPSTGRAADDSDAGFSVVEVLAAVTILVVILLSLTNLLFDSLDVALLSKQKEAAASLASDVIENASALGVTALLNNVTGTCPVPSGTTPPLLLLACNFQQGYTGTQVVDATIYTVQVPAITATAAPVPVTITVTWTQRSNGAPVGPTTSFTTTSDVGT